MRSKIKIRSLIITCCLVIGAISLWYYAKTVHDDNAFVVTSQSEEVSKIGIHKYYNQLNDNQVYNLDLAYKYNPILVNENNVISDVSVDYYRGGELVESYRQPWNEYQPCKEGLRETIPFTLERDIRRLIVSFETDSSGNTGYVKTNHGSLFDSIEILPQSDSMNTFYVYPPKEDFRIRNG
ncbi:MAG: hypothetical protein ACRC5C_03475 [Bacilli bacterium]